MSSYYQVKDGVTGAILPEGYEALSEAKAACLAFNRQFVPMLQRATVVEVEEVFGPAHDFLPMSDMTSERDCALCSYDKELHP